MSKRLLWVPLLMLWHGWIWAQTDTTTVDLYDMSLEQLLDMEISINSKSKETTRESAGIVSVVTKEDIRANQCRDLVDVFQLIAGFNLAKDEDYTSVFSRGLYGFEGRILVMVDGMQMSELYFGAYTLGNDFPIHLIERIEVIRGPGSVLYGGMAELAVVNIITRRPTEQQGGGLTARYGRLPKTYGHYDVGLDYGRQIGPVQVSLMAWHGQAMRSDAQTGFVTRPTVFEHNRQSAGIENTAAHFGLHWAEHTSLTMAYQNYRNNYIRSFTVDPLTGSNSDTDLVFDTFDQGVEARKVSYQHSTLSSLLSHTWSLAEGLELKPSLAYQYSFPYQRDVPREDVSVQRIKPSVYALYERNKLNLSLGAEYFADMAQVERPDPTQPNDFLRTSIDQAGRDQLTISNLAAFGNARYKWSLGATTLSANFGGRFDYNQLYGQRLSPRMGLNWVGERLHTKLLYSSAFRAPLVGNNAFSRYGLNPDPALDSRPSQGVRPEYTNVYEFEIGYLFSDELFWVANAFYQEVHEIIEYRYNYQNGDLYSDNGGRIATYGVESELKYRSRSYQGVLNASWVQPRFFDHTNPWAYAYNAPKGADTYITPDSEDGYPTRLELLGVPALKLYTNHHLRINKQVGVQANWLYVGPRYEYAGKGSSRQLAAQSIFGLGVCFSDVLGFLDIDLTVHDLLNERQRIATAWYDAQYVSLPYKGREFSISLRYHFGEPDSDAEPKSME